MNKKINNYNEYYFSKNQQQKILLFNKIISFISILFYLTLFFLTLLIKNNSIMNFFNIYNNKKIINIKIFIIGICVICLIFSLLYSISSWLTDYEKYISYKMQFIVLSILSVNIFNFIINVIIYFYEKNIKKIFCKKNKHIILKLIGFRKWFILDFIMIAVFISLVIILDYIESNILPGLPNGGSIALKFIPLIVISFLHSCIAGWLTGVISSLMSLLFVKSGNIISPWSYILDYFLPMMAPSIVGIMKFKVNNDRNYITYVNYIIICFLPMLIIWFFQFLSGVVVWNVIFPDAIWLGYSGWIYSVIYNFIHVFLFTYPITQIIVPVILRSLSNYYIQKYANYYLF